MAQEPITVDNWGFPPNNRWSFQHVQSLFPTVRIRRGAGPVCAFEEDLRNLDEVTYLGADGSERTVATMLEQSYSDAFLVVKDSVIITEQYFNGMRADSHHLINSVTKSFIGMLVGILADQGILDIDDPVVRHVPELKGTAFDKTTVRTALDMSAAVAFGEDYADPEADFWVETSVVGWRPALVRPGAPKTLLEHARSLADTDQEEDEKYHYRTVLTNVLGMVLERAAHTALPELMETELFSKLGPEQDACIVADRSGFPYVGAGMNACARDLARFGAMVVAQGRFNGQQIVPASWIDDTRRGNAHVKRMFAESEHVEALPGGHYRNQFWVSDSDRGILLAIGIHGQTIHMNMSTNTVIVKFSSQPESVDREMFQDTFAAMDALSEMI